MSENIPGKVIKNLRCTFSHTGHSEDDEVLLMFREKLFCVHMGFPECSLIPNFTYSLSKTKDNFNSSLAFVFFFKDNDPHSRKELQPKLVVGMVREYLVLRSRRKDIVLISSHDHRPKIFEKHVKYKTEKNQFSFIAW